MGLVRRAVGVIVSPRETFAAVAAHPRVFGILLLSLLLMILPQAWFLSTDIGKEALLDQQVQTMESFGVTISDQAYEQMEARLAYAPYTQAVAILVIVPLFFLIATGIFMTVFNAFMGGSASFKQVYAVLAHTGIISGLQQLFTMPISYAQAEMSSPTRLSVFLPMLDPMGFIHYFLSAIDLFLIWVIVAGSIGLGVLYRRSTGPIAMAQLALYVVIALGIAAWRAS